MALEKKQQQPAPLFDTPIPGSNTPEWSVSDISKRLKQTVEDSFGHVRVRGEISECKLHTASGHLYMTLKDEGAILAAVCWKGTVSRLPIKPQLGMEVVCTGRITTYMGQSKYQLVVEGMALAGIGALLKMLEERKKKLAAEGLFDAARKKPIPTLPNVIGVITSPTGAVIRDILHRLSDRFPRHVLLWPVAVQGDGAAEQIAAAINGFNALPVGGNVPRPDVLIVARGGGSVEDLMPFNEEVVVRAAAGSTIPLISAVGHETDTTLIDFAASLRAPTPTAAAEMAVPVRHELLANVQDMDARMGTGMARIVTEQQQKLNLLGRALGDPLRVLEPLMQRFDERVERLMLATRTFFERRQSRLQEASARLRHPRDVVRLAIERLNNLGATMHASWREYALRRTGQLDMLSAMLRQLSPRAVLGRGYALVQGNDGKVITSALETKKGQKVSINFHDGAKHAVIGEE